MQFVQFEVNQHQKFLIHITFLSNSTKNYEMHELNNIFICDPDQKVILKKTKTYLAYWYNQYTFDDSIIYHKMSYTITGSHALIWQHLSWFDLP
jgi:hypothetical protein